MKLLFIRNRQRAVPVSIPYVRKVLLHLMENELGLDTYELGAHLVGPKEMARINRTYLQHEGPTDVITFPYTDPPALHGELFVCPSVARLQSREFKTSWQAEVVRYLAHGILHLQGHDDREPAKRRLMKREENRLMRRLERRFQLAAISSVAGRKKLQSGRPKPP